MIARTTGLWCGLFAGTALTALLAGCQSSAPLHRPQSSPNQGDERQPKINTRQTADVQIALGRSLEKRGETAQAMAAYREAVKQDPHRGDAYLRLAILHDQQGHFNEAAEFYAKALEAQPGDPEIYCDRGYSLYLQRRWADAEINLRQAIALKRDHARAHNNLGLVLAHTDRYDEALAEFRKGRCNQSDAHANLAFCQTMDGSLTDARKNYEIALAANPSSKTLQQSLRQLDGLTAQHRPVASAKPVTVPAPEAATPRILDETPTTHAAPPTARPTQSPTNHDEKVEFLLTEVSQLEPPPMHQP